MPYIDGHQPPKFPSRYELLARRQLSFNFFLQASTPNDLKYQLMPIRVGDSIRSFAVLYQQDTSYIVGVEVHSGNYLHSRRIKKSPDKALPSIRVQLHTYLPFVNLIKVFNVFSDFKDNISDCLPALPAGRKFHFPGCVPLKSQWANWFCMSPNVRTPESSYTRARGHG